MYKPTEIKTEMRELGWEAIPGAPGIYRSIEGVPATSRKEQEKQEHWRQEVRQQIATLIDKLESN